MTSTTGTIRFALVPDHLCNADGSVDPEKVRWHVNVQRYVNGRRADDAVYSYATIQEAFATLNGGYRNPTPVIPCGLFGECEHCAQAMA